MVKNYERKHYFVVSAILLVVFSPLIIWLFPYLLQRVLFDMSANETAWMIETPRITYRFFMIAWVFLLIGSVASYFFYKFKILIVMGCLIIAGGTMYIGIKPVTVLNSAGFIFHDSPFDEEIKYSWEDVEKVYLIIEDETNEQSIEFHYKDKETFVITNKSDVLKLTPMIQNIKNTYGFSFTRKE